jgi:hypothetical protein
LAAIQDRIEAELKFLLNLVFRPGPMFRAIEGKAEFKGHDLSEDDRTFHIPSLEARRQMLTTLIEKIGIRYQDLESPVLRGARVLDFRTWPLELENKPGKFSDIMKV